MSSAIYPGSFDPITLGHLDIIRRAAALFDTVYVCVMVNCEKTPLFTMDERVALIRASVSELKNVQVDACSDLLADYAREKDVRVLIKGVRNATDFDSESQMAAINRGLWEDLETLLLPAGALYRHFSSTMVREMIRYGQPMERYVPLPVAEEIKRKGWR